MVWYYLEFSRHTLSQFGGGARFLTTDGIEQLISMLRRGYKNGFCEKLHVCEEIMSQADMNLLTIIQNPSHCIYASLFYTKIKGILYGALWCSGYHTRV